MRTRRTAQAAVLLAVIFSFCLCLSDTGAQQQRRRRRTRRAVPVATPTPDGEQPNSGAGAQGSDAAIISTTDPSAANSTGATRAGGPAIRPRPTEGQPADPDAMRHTVDRLSDQVIKLTEKLNQMESQQRTLVDLERLSRAEQRAENLRAQLRDVETKQSDLQARAEQIDYDIQPENIERALAGFGTTRPEDARAQRRRQLESEKTRVAAQLESLASSRTRLESDIATADAEVALLRQRVNVSPGDATQAATPQPSGDTYSTQPPAGTASPTPTPPPPPR